MEKKIKAWAIVKKGRLFKDGQSLLIYTQEKRAKIVAINLGKYYDAQEITLNPSKL
jgi:hypothetical protein